MSVTLVSLPSPMMIGEWLPPSMYAGVGVVVVADDVAVTVDAGGVDVAGVAGVHDAAVGGGVGGLVAEGDVAEAEVERAVLGVRTGMLIGAHEVSLLLASCVSLWLAKSVCGAKAVCGENARGDAVVVRDRVLQTVDRISAAEEDTRRGGAGGDRLELGGADVRQAGVAQGAVGVPDERRGHVGAAEQVEDVVEEVRHWSAFRLWVLFGLVSPGFRRSGDYVMGPPNAPETGPHPSLIGAVTGCPRGDPLGD